MKLTRITDDYSTKPIDKKWFLIDADGIVLGRLATKVADIIRGKNKPIFSKSMDAGDFVVVVNMDKVKLTGGKETKKIYYSDSGYTSGMKAVPAGVMRQKHPERMLYLAVKNMLPKAKLSDHILLKLKVYRGEAHPHAAQKPEKLEA
jgi:large subunit ribosomal protein L13